MRKGGNQSNQFLIESSVTIARKAYEDAMKESLLSNYTFPTKPSSDGFYHTYVPDPTKKSGRRQIKASTLEILKSKVYQYERGIGGVPRKTFREVFELYQENYIKYVRSEEKRYSANNTINRRNSEFRRFYDNTAFADMYMDEITKKDIKNFIYTRLQLTPMAKSVYANMSGLIRVVFKFAADEGMITDNPAATVDFFSQRILSMLTDSKSLEERTYSDEEIEMFITECHERQERRPRNISPFALEMQILTGMRRGEICPLKWSDIIVDEKGVKCLAITKELLYVEPNIANKKGRYVIVNHTKTSMDRRIPIWDELDEYLEKLKALHILYYKDSDYLFPGHSEEGCLGLKAVYSLFYNICQKNSIPVTKDCIRGTHAFRRNFAKRIDDPNVSSKLLGNQPRILKKNYYDGLDMSKAVTLLNGVRVTQE